MKIGVIGLNHEYAALAKREIFSEFLASLNHNIPYPDFLTHTVILSTCNRSEIYFFSEDVILRKEAITSFVKAHLGDSFTPLYTHYGWECFYHLAKVTSGLNSALFGETEIQGQVKKAYEHALKKFSLPKPLNFLFQKSLKIGKEIRRSFPPSNGQIFIEDLVMMIGKQIFRNPFDSKILFVGTSEINKRLLYALKSRPFKQIAVCNRTKEHAESLAKKEKVYHETFSHRARWLDYDWIFMGTSSPITLIQKDQLPTGPIPKKLLIDLGVPRNIDPSVGNHPDISLFNIDDITSSAGIQSNHSLKEYSEALTRHLVDRHFTNYQRKESANYSLVTAQ